MYKTPLKTNTQKKGIKTPPEKTTHTELPEPPQRTHRKHTNGRPDKTARPDENTMYKYT
jgi:hypothetical protein